MGDQSFLARFRRRRQSFRSLWVYRLWIKRTTQIDKDANRKPMITEVRNPVIFSLLMAGFQYILNYILNIFLAFREWGEILIFGLENPDRKDISLMKIFHLPTWIK